MRERMAMQLVGIYLSICLDK